MPSANIASHKTSRSCIGNSRPNNKRTHRLKNYHKILFQDFFYFQLKTESPLFTWRWLLISSRELINKWPKVWMDFKMNFTTVTCYDGPSNIVAIEHIHLETLPKKFNCYFQKKLKEQKPIISHVSSEQPVPLYRQIWPTMPVPMSCRFYCVFITYIPYMLVAIEVRSHLRFFACSCALGLLYVARNVTIGSNSHFLTKTIAEDQNTFRRCCMRCAFSEKSHTK